MEFALWWIIWWMPYQQGLYRHIPSIACCIDSRVRYRNVSSCYHWRIAAMTECGDGIRSICYWNSHHHAKQRQTDIQLNFTHILLLIYYTFNASPITKWFMLSLMARHHIFANNCEWYLKKLIAVSLIAEAWVQGSGYWYCRSFPTLDLPYVLL